MLRWGFLVGALVAFPLLQGPSCGGCQEEPPLVNRADGGGWRTADWSPPECPLWAALDPAAEEPAPGWVSCPDGVKGCVMWNDELGLDDVHRYGNRTIFTGSHDGDLVVYELDKGPIAAWRTSCTLQGGFLSDSGLVLQLDSGYYPGNRSFLYFGSVDQVVAGTGAHLWVDQPDATPEAHVGYAVLGSGLVALQDFHSVWIADTASGSVTQHAEAPWVSLVAVRGSEALVVSDDQPTSSKLELLRAGGTSVTLYQYAAGIDDVESDGIDVTWKQKPAGSSTREIWTSPWASDPASFKPRLVTTLADDSLCTGGGEGFYTCPDFVVRLADGKLFKVPHLPGPTRFGVFGVVGHELWLDEGDNAGWTTVRIPMASIENP